MLLIGAHSQVHCDSRLNKAHLTHVFSIMHITDFCAWNIRQHFGTVLGAILEKSLPPPPLKFIKRQRRKKKVILNNHTKDIYLQYESWNQRQSIALVDHCWDVHEVGSESSVLCTHPQMTVKSPSVMSLK